MVTQPMSCHWRGGLGEDWALELGPPTAVQPVRVHSCKRGGGRKGGAHGGQPESTGGPPASGRHPCQQARRVRCRRECQELRQHPISPLPWQQHASLFHATMCPAGSLCFPTSLAVRRGQGRCKWVSGRAPLELLVLFFTLS